jgi:hypothetical protein
MGERKDESVIKNTFVRKRGGKLMEIRLSAAGLRREFFGMHTLSEHGLETALKRGDQYQVRSDLIRSLEFAKWLNDRYDR